MLTARTLIAAGLLLGAVSAPRAAEACAAPFFPPASDQTLVRSHKVALSVGKTRTVLWHQLAFQGDPGEFSWVMPVKKGAYLEESTDAWFEALDAFTSTRVFETEPVGCASPEPSQDVGCGSDTSDTASGNGGGKLGNPNVNVVHEGTVGPYQTVTLASSDPKALEDWLEKNGYTVPDAARPVIAAYVAEGFDFIALRLNAGKGVDAMTPVRVVTPGGDPELPLRMAAIGASERVRMTLFVIGDGRFTVPSLPELALPLDQLTWDYASQSSNYQALQDAALAGGSGQLTTFALGDGFRSSLTRPDGSTLGFGYGSYSSYSGSAVSTLGQLYFDLGRDNGDASGSCSDALYALEANTGSTVLPACEEEDVTKCPPIGAFELSEKDLRCEGLADLGAALVGRTPEAAWLTRIELELDQAALSVDRTLALHAGGERVENLLTAPKSVNPPCAQPLFTGSKSALIFGGLFGAWVGRRRSRRLERRE